MAIGKIKVTYRLSQSGLRKLLMKGKEGRLVQEITFEAEITSELLSMTTVDTSGTLNIDLVSPINVGGFFSISHVAVDDPIFTLEQATEQLQIFQVEIEKFKKQAKEREKEIENQARRKKERQQQDLIAYARNKAAYLEKQYGTLVWLSIMEYAGSSRDEFDRMVEDFKKECAEQENQKGRQKSEIEKRLWIRQYGSERLKKRLESGEPCHALYVRERILTDVGTGWYVDPDKSIEHEPPKVISSTALHLARSLFKLGMNPKITWLSNGITRGEPPEGDDRSARDYDEFYSYDDPACLPAIGACEAIIVENYLGRYDIYYPVGPMALSEGLEKFLKESRWRAEDQTSNRQS